MPPNLEKALVWLIYVVGVFLILFIVWLFVCDCQHRIWGAAGLNSVVAIHSTVCSAGDGTALAELRMHPDRLG
jgi:hypothetical protein